MDDELGREIAKKRAKDKAEEESRKVAAEAIQPAADRFLRMMAEAGNPAGELRNGRDGWGVFSYETPTYNSKMLNPFYHDDGTQRTATNSVMLHLDGSWSFNGKIVPLTKIAQHKDGIIAGMMKLLDWFGLI